jgi:polyphosphate kinase
VTCPVYDPDVKTQLIDTFDIGWKGNVKSRLHSEKLDNQYRTRGKDPIFRAQFETYNYFRERIESGAIPIS